MELATTQRQRSLDEWLDAPRDDDQYDRFLAACLDGTCEWMLSHPSYLAWEKRSETEKVAKLLWIHGPAGFGKTILSASLIRHIKEKMQLPLVYCFSSNHAQNADGLSSVIRTWLTQLVRLDKGAFEVAYQFLQEHNTRKASKEDTWTLLSEVMVQIQDCVLVLDGLDEFQSVDDQRKIFLSRLKKCLQSTTTSALITSRTEFDINSELRPSVPEIDKYSILECKISEDTVKTDIDAFALSIVDRSLPGKGDSLRRELSARMAERCQGQFLWLKLQESGLRGGKNAKKLRESIEVMPQGLHSSYEHSWNNIQALGEPDRNSAIGTLRWLTFALQPLTVQMLAEAMVINLDMDSEGFAEDDLPDDINDEYIDGEIKQLCGSLVEVQGHEDPGYRVVRLVHASVSDFLTVKLPPSPFLELASTQSPSSSAQHSMLAACCICFLDVADTWRPGGGQRDPSFRNYAANTWFRHLRMSGVDYYHNASVLAHRFLKPGNDRFEMWKKEFERSASSSDLTATSFHYAAAFGLLPTMIALHDKERVDVNSVGGYFGTALQAVCAQGDIEAFERLMHWHADPTIRGGYYGSALNAAAYCGNIHMIEGLLDTGVSACPPKSELHEAMRLAAGNGSLEVVKFLLDRGASIDPPEALYPIQRYSMESETETTPLLAAATRSQVEVLRLLLERGADPNLWSLPDKAGRPALGIATWVDCYEAVELLLLHGADVHSQTLFGTPLHLASLFGDIDIVRALLDNGATVDANDIYQQTPLHNAATNGRIEVVACLLHRGANPNIQYEDLETPLHIASRNGIDMVKTLLEKGATIDATNEYQQTPLHIAAAEEGKIEVLAHLLHKGANPNAQDINLRTPLHFASANSNIDKIKALLEKGATIDATDKYQRTPLHMAARKGRIDMLVYLLHKGANPNAQDIDLGTPLHSASANSSIDEVKALLEKGATIDATDKYQLTPLHIIAAAIEGRIEVLTYFLHKNANPNAQDINLRTPLHFASANSNIDKIKALLEKGATLDANDKYQQTPLEIAASEGEINVVAYLLQRGADPNVQNIELATPLHYASANDVVEALLEKGAIIDANDKYQQTPLHNAARDGRIDVLAYLLQRGANPNAQNVDGWTPLCIAAEVDQVGAITTLLEQSADVNINAQTSIGFTPLGIAISKDNTEIARLLIDRGADINTQSEGQTPLGVAVLYKYIEIARLLIDRGADINVRNEYGETPMNFAIQRSTDEFVDELIQSGADLGNMDRYGMTCSNWLQRARPYLMIPLIEGQKPDKISSGPDMSVLRGTLLNLAEDMRSDTAKARSKLYNSARCFLVLDMEDQARHAHQALHFVKGGAEFSLFCTNCGRKMTAGNSYFECKICPNTGFCESCMEGHSEERRKVCLSHKFFKVDVPLQDAPRNGDDEDKAFKKWLDEIIEQFTD